MDRKEALTREFFDTEVWCRSTEKLRRAMRQTRSGSSVYAQGETVYIPTESGQRRGEIAVTDESALEAALRLRAEDEDRLVTVLNFASALTPGGGVRRGAGGGEESLCRCSTLYPDLKVPEYKAKFYTLHKEGGSCFYTDTMIYSPEILIIKRETPVAQRLPEEKWQKIDVISYASPNLRLLQESGQPLPSKEDLVKVYSYRAMKAMAVAVAHGCTHLIAGAAGCGAYRNPPELVARAWKASVEELGAYFDQVVFAVPASLRGGEALEAFQRVFA